MIFFKLLVFITFPFVLFYLFLFRNRYLFLCRHRRCRRSCDSCLCNISWYTHRNILLSLSPNKRSQHTLTFLLIKNLRNFHIITIILSHLRRQCLLNHRPLNQRTCYHIILLLQKAHSQMINHHKLNREYPQIPLNLRGRLQLYHHCILANTIIKIKPLPILLTLSNNRRNYFLSKTLISPQQCLPLLPLFHFGCVTLFHHILRQLW